MRNEKKYHLNIILTEFYIFPESANLKNILQLVGIRYNFPLVIWIISVILLKSSKSSCILRGVCYVNYVLIIFRFCFVLCTTSNQPFQSWFHCYLRTSSLDFPFSGSYIHWFRFLGNFEESGAYNSLR